MGLIWRSTLNFVNKWLTQLCFLIESDRKLQTGIDFPPPVKVPGITRRGVGFLSNRSKGQKVDTGGYGNNLKNEQ